MRLKLLKKKNQSIKVEDNNFNGNQLKQIEEKIPKSAESKH